MMKAGADGTSTPIYINSGLRSSWIHGKVDRTPIEAGDLVVVDLTPAVRRLLRKSGSHICHG